MLALSANLAVALGLRLLVEGSCPSQATVQAQLAPLLPSSGVALLESPPTAAAKADVTARVEPLDDLLRVEVRDSAGRLISLRDQRRDVPCTDLAAFAAVVIATAVAARPQSAPPALTVPPALLPQPALPPRPRVTLEISLAGVLALTTARAAAGGSLDVQLAQPSDVFGLRLSFAGTSLRRVTIESGAADYTRLHAGVLARYRLRPAGARLALDVSAGLLGALVRVEGTGFAENLASQGFDVGAGGGARLTRFVALPNGALTLSLDLLALGWLRPQVLRLLYASVTETSPASTLPAWDILLSLGIGWQRHLP